MLSGFVIAKAYRGRIADGSLSVAGFCLVREIRMLSLISLGTLLAAAVEMTKPGLAGQGLHAEKVLKALALGSVLFPTFSSATLEPDTIPFNKPVWSLFLETIANLVFANGRRFQALSDGIAVLLTANVAALPYGGGAYSRVDPGSSVDTFWSGFARVSWSFGIGVVLFRIAHRAPHMPFAFPVLALLGVLALPHLNTLNGTCDALCILFVLPAIVFAASTASLGACGRRLSKASGDGSFPLYALHYPLVRIVGVVLVSLHLAPPGRLCFVAAATALITLVSALAFKFFDVLVRRYMTRVFVGEHARESSTETAKQPRATAEPA